MSSRRSQARKRDTGMFDSLQDGPSLEETDSAIFSPEMAAITGAVKTNSLRHIEDGTFKFGRFRLTPVGFTLPEDATQDEWSQLGQILFDLEGSIQWLIGDWLAYGEAYQWGETAAIAEALGRDVSTLYVYKSVAKSVQFLSRDKNLSFNHHKAVMKFSPETQAEWLAYARENKLSVNDLRQAIRDAERQQLPTPAQNGFDPGRATRKARGLFKLFQRDMSQLSKRKRGEHLDDIAILRRLLDDLEHRLRDE